MKRILCLSLSLLVLLSACGFIPNPGEYDERVPSETTSHTSVSLSPSPSQSALPTISDSISSCKLQSPYEIEDLTRHKDLNLGFYEADFISRYGKKAPVYIGGNGSTSTSWSINDCTFHFSYGRLQWVTIQSSLYSVMGDLKVNSSASDLLSIFPNCYDGKSSSVSLWFSVKGEIVDESKKYYTLRFTIDDNKISSIYLETKQDYNF